MKFKKLNQTYIRIATFPVYDILPLIQNNFIYTFQGILNNQHIKVDVKMFSERYFLFKEKGTTCKKCGIVGTYFAGEFRT